ncbi:hypothetical protein UlMin_039157 [Ulmus minor]
MGNSSKDDSATDGDTSGGESPPSKTSLFAEGEKVLAYHGPRIYEAKVQKAEIKKNEWRYFVHYLGWNKNWDEWVGVDRLMKNSEENVRKQQALDRKQGVDKSSKSGRSGQAKSKPSAGTVDAKVEKEDLKNNGTLIKEKQTEPGRTTDATKRAKGKKRKSDSSAEKDNTLTMEKHVKIQIPSTLKKQLVDDFEFVNKQDKLVKLPRSPTIDDILTKYLEYRIKKDSIDSVGEILKGIRCYFDKALPTMLLYKKERKQFRDAVVDDVSPSTIYGAEHLLRLFVKLPELLSYVNMEEETQTTLQQKLLDFLRFIQKNHSSFLDSAYDSAKSVEGRGKGKDD